MNQGDWISITIGVTIMVAGYWASSRFQKWLLAKLSPLLGRFFPELKLEPWLFESIAVDDLPQKQRRYFESREPGFVSRGFAQLGDFVLRRDPQPSCARLMLSPDRTTIASIHSYLGQTGI